MVAGHDQTSIRMLDFAIQWQVTITCQHRVVCNAHQLYQPRGLQRQVCKGGVPLRHNLVRLSFVLGQMWGGTAEDAQWSNSCPWT